MPNSWKYFHKGLDPQTCAEASTSEGVIAYGEAVRPRDLRIHSDSTTSEATSTWLVPEPVYGHPVRRDARPWADKRRLGLFRSHCAPWRLNSLGTALFVAAVLPMSR